MLTPAQLTTFKAAIAANTATVPFPTPTPINTLPNTGDANNEIAIWYNALANYWVWASNVSRASIYTTPSDLAPVTLWDWAVYKAQSVSEQGAWTQMFMGDQADFGKKNLRQGVWEIFHANAAANTLRAHIFAVGRRKATNAEKLFGVAQSADTNTGNDGVGGNRGLVTNPDAMGFEGTITTADVEAARNLP